MKFVRCIALCAAIAAGPAVATPETRHWTKEDLVTLYLLSVAAERCGFPMTEMQAETIDRAARAITERLKLRPSQATALYSQADIEFERQGSGACDRDGSFAKTFKETLQKMTGP